MLETKTVGKIRQFTHGIYVLFITVLLQEVWEFGELPLQVHEVLKLSFGVEGGSIAAYLNTSSVMDIAGPVP